LTAQPQDRNPLEKKETNVNLQSGNKVFYPAMERGTEHARMKVNLIVLLLIILTGCQAGTVKPFLNNPEFKAENEPIRTLRILIVTDGTYRKEETEKLISKCSRIMDDQVGIRLQIVGSQEIKWDFRSDSTRMLAKIFAETWEKSDHFDLAVAVAYYDERTDPHLKNIGRIDSIFWRYIVVKEPEPNLFLHELIHAFLTGRST
jgi:hypothetical protein